MSLMNGSLFCTHKPTIPIPCKSFSPHRRPALYPLSRSKKHYILPTSQGFETLSFHGRFIQLATVHPPPSSVSSSASSSESIEEEDKSKDKFVVGERERKRRERIGTANKGRTPWNKGKSHSPATIAKMKERNTIVMQDPRMREKLRQHSHPQSEETKEKLRNIMKSRMEHERKQLTVLQEWKTAIAKTAQIGTSGDDMLWWDSYDNLKEQLRQEYLKSKRKKKDMVRRSWTLEQRLRLSESVRAKWQDPDYRNKVIENIREKRLKCVKKKKSNLSISDVEFDNSLNTLLRAPITEGQMEPLETKIGSYSDPSSKEKLAKLIRARNIKVQERTSDSDFRDESR